MQYRVLINVRRTEGLYPVYEPFFDEIVALGGICSDTIIEIPDSVDFGLICDIVKKYRDYIQIVPIIDNRSDE